MQCLFTLHLESPLLIFNLMSGDHNNNSKNYFDIQKDVKVNQNITSVWWYGLNYYLIVLK